MIRHIVLTKFKADVKKAEIDSLFAKLADLKSHIPGMVAFRSARRAWNKASGMDFQLILTMRRHVMPIWNIQSIRP